MRITKITVRKTESEIVSRRIDGMNHDIEIEETDTDDMFPTLTENLDRLLQTPLTRPKKN